MTDNEIQTSQQTWTEAAYTQVPLSEDSQPAACKHEEVTHLTLLSYDYTEKNILQVFTKYIGTLNKIVYDPLNNLSFRYQN